MAGPSAISSKPERPRRIAHSSRPSVRRETRNDPPKYFVYTNSESATTAPTLPYARMSNCHRRWKSVSEMPVTVFASDPTTSTLPATANFFWSGTGATPGGVNKVFGIVWLIAPVVASTFGPTAGESLREECREAWHRSAREARCGRSHEAHSAISAHWLNRLQRVSPHCVKRRGRICQRMRGLVGVHVAVWQVETAAGRWDAIWHDDWIRMQV